jgi:hypothetical protein
MAGRMVPEGGWQNRLKPARTPRVKVDRHRQFIKSLPCICCMVERGAEIQADDPMHIRSASQLHGKDETGGGRTADDRWTLPGCRPHHDEQHRGDELAFWRAIGIDPFLLALVLWGVTGNYYAAVLVMREHVKGAGRRRAVESMLADHDL